MAHKPRLNLPVVPTHPPLTVTQANAPLAFNQGAQVLVLPNSPVFSVSGNTLSGTLGNGTAFSYTPSTPPDVFLQSGVYDPLTTSIVLAVSNGNTVSVPLAALLPVAVAASSTVTLSGDGTAANPILATARISTNPGNVISATPTGLFVAPSPANDFWRSGIGATILPDGAGDVIDAIARTGQTTLDTNVAGDSGLTLADLLSRASVQLAAGDAGVTDTNMTAVGVDTTGKVRLSNALSMPDIRNTSPVPQDYAAGASYVFKALTSLAIPVQSPAAGTYAALHTIRRYAVGGDFSGGQVYQEATTDIGRKFYRVSTNATTWGEWREYETQGSRSLASLGDLLPGSIIPNGYTSAQFFNGSWSPTITLPAQGGRVGEIFTYNHFAGFNTDIQITNTNMLTPLTATLATGGASFVWNGTGKWHLVTAHPAAQANDFWRSGVGATALPDGTTDITETIRRNGSVGLNVDPLSTFDNAGSFASNFVATPAAAYTVLPSDYTLDLNLNAAQAVTLPLPAASPRRVYILRNATPVQKTITAYRTISGNASAVIRPFTTLTLVSSGTEWLSLAELSELAPGQTLSTVSPVASAQTASLVAFSDLSFRYSINANTGNLEVRSSTPAAVTYHAYGEEYFFNLGGVRNLVSYPASTGVATAAANTGAWAALNAGGAGVNEQLMYTIFTATTSYEAKVFNFNGVSIHVAITRLT